MVVCLPSFHEVNDKDATGESAGEDAMGEFVCRKGFELEKTGIKIKLSRNY